MPPSSNHTPSAFIASAAGNPCAPLWFAFYAVACSVLGALLGRFAPLHRPSSSDSPHSTLSLPPGANDDPFSILLRLIALDWLRRSRTAPASPGQLLRRSPVLQAAMRHSLAPAPAFDFPCSTSSAPEISPASASALAAARAHPAPSLALTPSSPLNAAFAPLTATARPALSARSLALLTNGSSAFALFPLLSLPILSQSAFRNPQSAILHSAFPRAPA